MPYDKDDAVDKYEAMVSISLSPHLVTQDEVYNISPEAVRSLRFSNDGISFICTYDGIIRHIAVFKDDIIGITE